MRKLLVVVLLLQTSFAYAQKFSVKGQLLDTLSAPLPAATVLILNANDSSLVNFNVTNTSGMFEIKNLARADYLFRVTYVGFKTHTQRVSPPAEGTVVELGTVKLETASTELGEIEIQGARAPVTVKRDTIEFNAGSFRTKENATVEELLKKLPGVEVDNDGNITAQGEQVQRVTVDGKNFFGNDPKVATRNLPADAVDKVQVFDKKSDQATFSGVDDGQREKTINLALKEEKRKGVFGTLQAGAGTEDRFQGRANLNRFSKEKQFSFLAMGNNVNQQGFSMEEYMNFTGGSQQMMRGGGGMRLTFSGDNQNGVPLNFGNRANGIMTTYGTGINFNNEFNTKTEVNGSYFYNYLQHQRNQSTQRDNFVPGGTFTNEEQIYQDNNNSNHRVNTTIDHKIDSMNLLKATVNVGFNETEMFSQGGGETIGVGGITENTSERTTRAQGSNTSLNSTLLWRHKFGKKGRTMSTNLQFGFNDNDRDGFLDAVNTYKRGDSLVRIQQENFQQTGAVSYGASVSYTEPLGKRRYIEGNYSYRTNRNDVDRDVYDITGAESIFNTQLSSEYNSNYQYHRGGLNYRISRSKYNVVLGGSYQQTQLAGDLTTFGVEINKTYQNVLPAVHVNYDFTDTKHLRFDYETSVQEPGIQELQPVVDNSDPLNLYVGNPELRPAYSQSWRMNFMTFNPSTFVSFFTFADVDYISNAIVNSQRINEQLIRFTQPVNVRNSVRFNGNSSVGFPIAKIKSRLNFGVDYRANRSMALLNDRENQVSQTVIGGNVRYSFTYKEVFDLNLSADVDRQGTSYEFDQPDQLFINSTYSAEANLTFLRDFRFSATLEYLQYKNEASGFDQSIPLLDLSISRFLLKNKAGELKIAAQNVLDKALGVSQTASINFVERQTMNSLGRYFMVSFTYALNKQLNPMGMRRGGGAMMRVIR